MSGTGEPPGRYRRQRPGQEVRRGRGDGRGGSRGGPAGPAPGWAPRPPGRRYSGRMRPGRPAGSGRRAARRRRARGPVEPGTALSRRRTSGRSSATRHSSGPGRVDQPVVRDQPLLVEGRVQDAHRLRAGARSRAPAAPCRRAGPGVGPTAECRVRERRRLEQAPRGPGPRPSRRASQRALRDAGVRSRRPPAARAGAVRRTTASGPRAAALRRASRPASYDGTHGLYVASRVTVKEKRSPR